MEAIFWPGLLLALGLGLLVAELFLPAGGVLGILAATSLGGSAYLALASSPGLGYRWVGFETLSVAGVWAAVIYGLPRTRLGRRVYLQPPSDADLTDQEHRGHVHDHLGRSGRALTPLRPSGMIDVGGRRVEALAESGLIGPGAVVTVVAVRSGRVVVREN